MEKRKKLAREKELQPVSDKELEVDINDIYPSEKGWNVFCAFHMTVLKIRLMKSVTALHKQNVIIYLQVLVSHDGHPGIMR